MSGDLWETPSYLFDPLNKEFGFEVDLCANLENHKCVKWTDDITRFALTRKPEPRAVYFCNPPYSRGTIDECMAAVRLLCEKGHTIVTLTRFDPSANWFKRNVDGVAFEVRMLDKRVVFKGATASYPFPCCVAVYGGKPVMGDTFYHIWGVSNE